MQNLFCPYCGRQISSIEIRTGQSVCCPYCRKSFINTLRDKPPVVTVKPKESKSIESIFGLHKGTCLIAAAIMVVGLVYCLSTYMGSRYQLMTIDKKTYRIDKHSGITSIINPDGTIVAVKEPVVIKNRELSYMEKSEVRGWAGLRYETSEFSGRFYNGNKDIVVTEVNIGLTYTNGTRSVSRVYKYKGVIDPLETRYISISIVNPGRDLEYSGWHIDSCKGHKYSE